MWIAARRAYKLNIIIIANHCLLLVRWRFTAICCFWNAVIDKYQLKLLDGAAQTCWPGKARCFMEHYAHANIFGDVVWWLPAAQRQLFKCSEYANFCCVSAILNCSHIVTLFPTWLCVLIRKLLRHFWMLLGDDLIGTAGVLNETRRAKLVFTKLGGRGAKHPQSLSTENFIESGAQKTHKAASLFSDRSKTWHLQLHFFHSAQPYRFQKWW